MGGYLITVGSDAHAAQKTGHMLAQACEMLKEIGFPALYYYENRKPVPFRSFREKRALLPVADPCKRGGGREKGSLLSGRNFMPPYGGGKEEDMREEKDRGVTCQDLDITGGFWKEKQELFRRVTVDAVYDRFEETGRFEALNCSWKEECRISPTFTGIPTW